MSIISIFVSLHRDKMTFHHMVNCCSHLIPYIAAHGFYPIFFTLFFSRIIILYVQIKISYIYRIPDIQICHVILIIFYQSNRNNLFSGLLFKTATCVYV